MSDELWKGRSFPRAALIGGAIIFGGSIIYAVLAKNYGIGRSEAEFAPAAVEREILFREIDLNNMEVFADGEKLGDFNVNDEGFIFGIVRGLGHYRTVNRASKEHPYILSVRVDGRLVLEDELTGEMHDMSAYGTINEASFRRLMDMEPEETPATEEAASAPVADPAEE